MCVSALPACSLLVSDGFQDAEAKAMHALLLLPSLDETPSIFLESTRPELPSTLSILEIVHTLETRFSEFFWKSCFSEHLIKDPVFGVRS